MRLESSVRMQRERRSKTDWDAVDWSMIDYQIARQLGCSRERVRQVRAARGLSPSRGVEKRTERREAQMRAVENWARCDGDIAAEIGCSTPTVNKWRKVMAPDTVGVCYYVHEPKHPWRSVDWGKSSAVIAAEMGVHQSVVSDNRRKYAPHTVRPISPRVDYSKVDFTKQHNKEISRITGANYGAVSWYRRVHYPETVGRMKAPRSAYRRHGFAAQTVARPGLAP